MYVADEPVGREVVLVVDDEASVLSCVCNILVHAGFVVLRAGSPAEALRVGAETRSRIDLMISDVIMPGLSGPKLAEEFAQLHPEMQCLFMAGLPDQPEVVERIIARGKPFLPKPFFPGALINKVREVLSKPSRSGFPAAV